jgi:hypothetical protein
LALYTLPDADGALAGYALYDGYGGVLAASLTVRAKSLLKTLTAQCELRNSAMSETALYAALSRN